VRRRGGGTLTNNEEESVSDLNQFIIDSYAGKQIKALQARIKELEAELDQTRCVYCHKPLNRPSPTCCVAHELEAENKLIKRELKKAVEKSRPSALAVLMDSGT
jgi:hypothetical protein